MTSYGSLDGPTEMETEAHFNFIIMTKSIYQSFVVWILLQIERLIKRSYDLKKAYHAHVTNLWNLVALYKLKLTGTVVDSRFFLIKFPY